MKLSRRLGVRVVVASIACGLVGLLVTRILGAFITRDIVIKNTLPQSEYLWRTSERTKCEAAPDTWTLSLAPGSAAYAYDAATLTSRNPGAPPVERELFDRLPAGTALAHIYQTDGIARGASLLREGTGPCSLVQLKWNAPLPIHEQMALSLAMPLVAASIAAALGFLAVLRPLTRRIARLRVAAERVGNETAYASAEPEAADDLGELSSSLDKAHARIRADTRRLERHLDDVAHDLRTPIASLQMALEQAADAATDASSVELLRGAIKDAVYLGGLTSNLRLASQLGAGWDPVKEDPRVDLVEAVERVASRARVFARRSGVALEVAVPDGAVFARCNPIAAEQAIGNVVDNAVSHGDRGGHVAVVLERAGDGFVLRIEDDGPGVAPAELPRLGERTFRSDEARQRDPRGSGLGLAITSEICTRCGWKLAFENADPRGLRVTISG